MTLRPPPTSIVRAALLAAALLAPGADARAQATRQVVDPLKPGLTAVSEARLGRGAGALPAGRPLVVSFAGMVRVEGHLARPHATDLQHSLRRIVVAAPDRVRQDWWTWSDADTARSLETTLIVGGRVLQRTGTSGPWTELAGRAAFDAALPAWTSVPGLVGARALAHRGDLGGGPVTLNQSVYHWTDALGQVLFELNMLDDPSELTIVRDDPRLGTLSQRIHYFTTSHLPGGVILPDSLVTAGYPVDFQWTLSERRVEPTDVAAGLDVSLPADITPAPPPAPADTTPRVEPLGAHAWAVVLPDADTRSLVLEFADHLVVLETSMDVPHGERLREAALLLAPGKPIRFVAFGHHHPDYTGGLRAFLADSATVVCAGANADYVREIAGLNFSQHPDRLARLGMRAAVKVDTLVAGRWSHADKTNEVVALDIGERSHHTDHYLVFWLPRLHLLFEGDLGFFTRDGQLRASRRAAGLLEAIDAARLAPATVVQGWPVAGNPTSVPMASLRALVAEQPAR